MSERNDDLTLRVQEDYAESHREGWHTFEFSDLAQRQRYDEFKEVMCSGYLHDISSNGGPYQGYNPSARESRDSVGLLKEFFGMEKRGETTKDLIRETEEMYDNIHIDFDKYKQMSQKEVRDEITAQRNAAYYEQKAKAPTQPQIDSSVATQGVFMQDAVEQIKANDPFRAIFGEQVFDRQPSREQIAGQEPAQIAEQKPIEIAGQKPVGITEQPTKAAGQPSHIAEQATKTAEKSSMSLAEQLERGVPTLTYTRHLSNPHPEYGNAIKDMPVLIQEGVGDRERLSALIKQNQGMSDQDIVSGFYHSESNRADLQKRLERLNPEIESLERFVNSKDELTREAYLSSQEYYDRQLGNHSAEKKAIEATLERNEPVTDEMMKRLESMQHERLEQQRNPEYNKPIAEHKQIGRLEDDPQYKRFMEAQLKAEDTKEAYRAKNGVDLTIENDGKSFAERGSNLKVGQDDLTFDQNPVKIAERAQSAVEEKQNTLTTSIKTKQQTQFGAIGERPGVTQQGKAQVTAQYRNIPQTPAINIASQIRK